MKFRIHAACVAALLVSIAAIPARGQVAYTGGAPNGQAGYDIFNDFRSADDIASASTIDFNLIRFWGLLPAGSTYVPTIFWQFLADDGGIPGSSVVAEGTTMAERTLRTPLSTFGVDSWRFELAMASPRSLAPGVYWLALFDGSPGDITDSSLLWETTDAASGSQFAVEFLPTNEWTGNWGGNLAFELRNEPPSTVPEPGTLMMLGTGLAGLAGIARRKFRG